MPLASDDPHPLPRRRRLRDRDARRAARILLRPVPRRESRLRRSSSTGFDQVDLVVVSHAAFDHLGDTDTIAARYGCPVICGGEVKAYLMAQGIPADADPRDDLGHPGQGRRHRGPAGRVPSLVADPACRTARFASGVPMAFVVYADENVRFYHSHDC